MSETYSQMMGVRNHLHYSCNFSLSLRSLKKKKNQPKELGLYFREEREKGLGCLDMQITGFATDGT